MNPAYTVNILGTAQLKFLYGYLDFWAWHGWFSLCQKCGLKIWYPYPAENLAVPSSKRDVNYDEKINFFSKILHEFVHRRETTTSLQFQEI